MIAALRAELVKVLRRRVLIVTAVTTLSSRWAPLRSSWRRPSRRATPSGAVSRSRRSRRRRRNRGLHDRGLLRRHVSVRRLRRRRRRRVLARHLPDDASPPAAPAPPPGGEDGGSARVRCRCPRRRRGTHLGGCQAHRPLPGRRDRHVGQRRRVRPGRSPTTARCCSGSAGYALLGMAVAVLVRSVPVALAIGIAWAGPFEHLLQDAWDPAQRFFPGLLLEAFVAGGTSDVSETESARHRRPCTSPSPPPSPRRSSPGATSRPSRPTSERNDEP